MFLYEEYDALRKYNHITPLPKYIADNLNPKFELRPYQRHAFENFVTHFESDNANKSRQVLFHMATGSGKTLIMAGLMLYLYKQGYRNFLFFVNLTNIVEKTRENFLNATSAKYLFADEIVIDGERVRINEVNNFQQPNGDSINIMFTTTQLLHSLWDAKEDNISFDDFDGEKFVLISDEAHHLNVDTRNDNSAARDGNYHSWQETVMKIFGGNRANILLEFTATCDINNANIRAEYTNKIIFNYPLQSFYDDKYSKEILSLRGDFDVMERALQAVILSQYRLKVFQDNRLNIKPVVLFKALKIADSRNFMAAFIDTIKNLSGENLRGLSKKFSIDVTRRAFKYFADKGISYETLAAELRDDFSAAHCISVNNENDADKKQLLLNSLEDADNPYRAIFEVKKLDEGWDVLNLFDIVRLYETRQSGGRNTSTTTLSEAQLIGRGARYCPFRINDEQPKFQRKYDNDVKAELRICETLYYHCQNDSRYISELNRALREIGLDTEKITRREYKLKDSFKADDIYKHGLIFVNDREIKSRADVTGLTAEIKNATYSYQAVSGASGSEKILSDKIRIDDTIPLKAVRMTVKKIADINYALVNKSLMKYPVYKFATLKKYFPNLASTRQFITADEYLGGISIEIKSGDETPTLESLYAAVHFAVGKIAESIGGIETTYSGTKDFHAKNICDIFHDKLVNYSAPHDDGVGISQSDSTVAQDLRINLSTADWFAYNDNFGTSEEKAFVKFFSNYVEELRKTYSKVYLVRNEREMHLYSFDDGQRFEPDFVLFLQKEDGGKVEQLQIFIEPKGTHLLAADAWKEKFLLQLEKNAVLVKKFADSNEYKIIGVHFYNRDDCAEFEKDFFALVDES